MEDHNRFDEELKKLVRGVERSVPPGVEERIRTAAYAAQVLPRKRAFHNPRLALASMAGLAALLLAVLVMIPSHRRGETPQIAEIRTEFEIADKNIKIIFVQKPDFPVLMTSF